MPSWAIAIIVTVITAIFGVIGALSSRVLIQMDRNQKALADSLKTLWGYHNTLAADFHELKGAHKVNHKIKG